MEINRNFAIGEVLTMDGIRISIRNKFCEMNGVQPNVLCLEINERLNLSGIWALRAEVRVNVKS